MAAWLYRLRDVGRIDDATFRALWRTFRAKGWNETEPGPALPRESATVWQQRVASLVMNGRISAAMGVEGEMVERLLGMG